MVQPMLCHMFPELFRVCGSVIPRATAAAAVELPKGHYYHAQTPLNARALLSNRRTKSRRTSRTMPKQSPQFVIALPNDWRSQSFPRPFLPFHAVLPRPTRSQSKCRISHHNKQSLQSLVVAISSHVAGNHCYCPGLLVKCRLSVGDRRSCSCVP